MSKSLRGWKYKNTTLVLISIIVLWLVADTEAVRSVITYVGGFGYIGAAITGVFFVSTFTVVPAGIVLVHLADTLNPFLLATAAGIGGMIGDLILFRFLKDRVFEELRPLFRSLLRKRHISLQKRRFSIAYLVLGAVIIASPFPDEIGIGLMGLSRIKLWQFVCLTFALDILGILAIVLIARAV
ncbi:MAG: hypothetical protein JWO43_586 [Candidatus Adlerbacteria bacterium]|nr:hypothetical protein [Candidatus Adlerbacteria bacterium]